MDLARIQQALSAENIDGWLFYDFRKSNPVAYQVLSLPYDDMYTRRWLYFVPKEGVPTALISAVESHVLRSLPGVRRVYRTWQEMHEFLQTLLRPGMQIAMEYSPLNAIPYMSRVDAGTVELVRSFGAVVVTSANMAQRFVSQLSDAQVESQREAGRRIIAAKDRLFKALGDDLRAGTPLDEYQVQQHFVALMLEAGIEVEEPPIVATNANSGNPHYEPTADKYNPIQRGDLVLFDFWGHLPEPGSVIADYTWVAFAGTRAEIPARQQEVFAIVRNARDAGIAFVQQKLAAGEQVEGGQVDDAVRSIIASAGYADYFVHRTGHSITTSTHGNGANIDNFETHDQRVLLANTCCSIEPGIYLPDFGIRSEVNLLISAHGAEVTGIPAQQEIVPLL